MERTSRTLARPSHSHTPHTHSPFLYQQASASLLPFPSFCCSLSSHSLIHTKTHHDNIFSLPLSCSSGKSPFSIFCSPTSLILLLPLFQFPCLTNKYSPKNQSVPSINIHKASSSHRTHSSLLLCHLPPLLHLFSLLLSLQKLIHYLFIYLIK